MVPVFEEVVADEARVLPVPFPAVVQSHQAEELELPDCDIGYFAGFCSFLAPHSDAHVRSCDHVHVICPISNSKGQIRRLFLHISDNVLLLHRSTPVADCLAGEEVGG